MTEALLTAVEVAERLAVSPSQVYAWQQEGHLPAYKLADGRAGPVRFRWSEVEAWLEGRRACGGAAA